MKQFASAAVSLLLVAATIFNAGCASTADGRTTQAQGTAIGAVGGAVLGGLIGAATGNRDNIARYAAAGAVAGGVAGFVYGTGVAKRKARYQRAEQWLDQEIAMARNANRRAYAYNSSLRKRIAALESRAATARRSGDKSAIRAVKGDLAKVRQEASQQTQQDKVAVSEVKQVLADSEARSASNYGAYKDEAAAFQRTSSDRGQLMDRLASLDNSLDR